MVGLHLTGETGGAMTMYQVANCDLIISESALHTRE